MPLVWRRSVAGARLLLSVAGILVEAMRGGPAASLIIPLLVLYAAFSLAALVFSQFDRSSRALLGLLLDCVVFMILCTGDGDARLWLCSGFYFYLMASAVLLHSTQQLLLVSVSALGYLLIVQPSLAPSLWSSLLPMTALGVVCSLLQRSLRDRLFQASRQAVLFRSEARQARQAEMERIAADFHDGPLQSFISFQLRLEVIRKMLTKSVAAAAAEVEQLQELVRNQTAELRAFVRSMRPFDVDGTELSASLSRTVEHFQKDTGIAARFVGSGELDIDHGDTSKEVLLVLREALTNIYKHARASRVVVTAERRGETLGMQVEDDGEGFELAGIFTLEELENLRVGPVSIRRRVRALGGDMVLESRPGSGAVLRFQFPL